MKAATFVYSTLASCIALGAGMPVQAGMAPFNPDNLSPVQLTHVAAVCETVLGLSPNERLEGGNRSGDDRLDFWTSHYRGCIVSLSDSLQAIAQAHMPLMAQVLISAGPQALPAAAGSFTYASAHEVGRREQLACGSLGIDLSRTEFNSCVSDLSQTFFSVDHPLD